MRAGTGTTSESETTANAPTAAAANDVAGPSQMFFRSSFTVLKYSIRDLCQVNP